MERQKARVAKPKRVKRRTEFLHATVSPGVKARARALIPLLSGSKCMSGVVERLIDDKYNELNSTGAKPICQG
jgi:hypothetical protein